MCKNRDLFVSYEESRGNNKVEASDGTLLSVERKGNDALRLVINGRTEKCAMQDVLYVPKLEQQIIYSQLHKQQMLVKMLFSRKNVSKSCSIEK